MNRLDLSLSIYPVRYIISAINDYKQIAKISYKIDEENNKAMLTIEPIVSDFTTIKNELCNYLIALISTDSLQV
jgi:hypothetical protein